MEFASELARSITGLKSKASGSTRFAAARSRNASWIAIAGLALAATALGASALHAQPAAEPQRTVQVAPLPQSDQSLGMRLWQAAKNGNEAEVRRLLDEMLDRTPTGVSKELSQTRVLLDKAIDDREKTRAEKIAEVREKMDAELKKQDDPKAVSEALKQANELFMLVPDKGAFVSEPAIQELIRQGQKAAREAEANRDWFTANEIFYRLYLLLGDQNQNEFKSDVERLSLRLSMIRMYTPEAFWKLRNDERLKENKSALPPYNGLGESYVDRLKGVDKGVVIQAVLNASNGHINSERSMSRNNKQAKGKDVIKPRDLIVAGIDALRTMITTTDLQAAFPALADEKKVADMIAFLDSREKEFADRQMTPSTTRTPLSDLLDDAIAMNHKTVNLPDEALLHEFGNGAMARLDDFSSIIWPDELARFDRMTTGKFVGVGVQIQIDDETQLIKIVTPLEGTPAQRAGIRAGDFIKKINGQSAVGISLNQAVDLITGPKNSDVTLAVEREGQEIEFELVRAVIDQPSVKGWKRSGLLETDWDWFIDHENNIGYIRMSTGFSDGTTKELKRAIGTMKNAGLNGLIFDLRFNPGGLLNEGIGVANVFIDEGPIVIAGGRAERAQKGEALLNDIPVVVLINQGSASASEIVSGAIRQYADKGDIDAIIVGERSFGKGSVQNVISLRHDEGVKMRLTTQYYMLPDASIIHKRPGIPNWGVDPHLHVDMLPKQITDAIKLRQDADVMPIDEHGQVSLPNAPRPAPEQLLTEGLDPQLVWALTLLQARAADAKNEQAARQTQ